MDGNQIHSRKRKAPKPLFEEVVVKEPIDKNIRMLPESQPSTSNSRRHRTSRHVQVDQEDFYRYAVGTKSKLKADEDPIFLADNAVIDSQCRFCLRKVDKSYLKLIEGALKAKVRSMFKLKVHPYDSYPYVCINCNNYVHAMFDFYESVIKSKILLRSEKVELIEDNSEWVSTKHVAAADTCRGILSRHRNHIERIYEAYEYRSNEQENFSVEKTESSAEDEKTVTKELSLIEECANEDEIGENLVEVKVEPDLSEHDDDVGNGNEDNDDCDQSNDSDTVDNENDGDYQPASKSPKNKIKIIDETNSESDNTNNSEAEATVKVKKGKRRKGTSEAKSKVKKKPGERKVRKPYEKYFVCTICGKTLHSATKESHMNQHSGVQPYTCPHEGCGVKFYAKAHRNRHISRFHNKKICDICGCSVLNSAGRMRDHMMHHATTEEAVACGICGKKFWTENYLRRHMIIHTDLFPHDCRYCGRKFKHKASKDTHERNMHEKKNDFGPVGDARSNSNETQDPPYINPI
ncbi:zinc finger protein 181-like [Uranotaenia lowii]|uniref:zinc finger protein 181-like n=1 Tax=Uranotaenia lowii TaxID=190385 RepID=UPI0024797B90|nr:zinc finger protein 181-like [Uranotaenia lowii]